MLEHLYPGLRLITFDLDDTLWPCHETIMRAEDALFDTGTAWRTARAYGAKPRILPSLPHALMLDEEWESTAQCIRDWLQQF